MAKAWKADGAASSYSKVLKRCNVPALLGVGVLGLVVVVGLVVLLRAIASPGSLPLVLLPLLVLAVVVLAFTPLVLLAFALALALVALAWGLVRHILVVGEGGVGARALAALVGRVLGRREDRLLEGGDVRHDVAGHLAEGPAHPLPRAIFHDVVYQ